MITLFNQLTSKELVDYNLFSQIIDSHYEKFKYLYYILKEVDLDTIADITCTADENTLSTSIIPNKIKHTDKLIYVINERKSEYKKADYFNINVSWCNKVIHIDISMSGDEKECDIYADRFI